MKMKQFYYINNLNNGLCDVTIYDEPVVYECEHGNEYDMNEFTLYSIPYYPDLELNIREHYESWKAHAMAFTTQRNKMLRAIACACKTLPPIHKKHILKRRRKARGDIDTTKDRTGVNSGGSGGTTLICM
ncbi:hypothetical protein FACS1894184_14130 [Clostridia bacterium]|nr:hypothetical protein FACS1894184_14130 [Clostridia bacterium]